MKRNQQGPTKLALEAMRLYSAGELLAAAEVANRALKTKPKDIEALSLLGVIESQTGQIETGAARLRRVVDLRPDSADAQFNLGCALQQLRDLDGAERHYNEAIRLKPNFATYRNNLGSLLQERNDLVRARQVLEEAHRADPGHENCVINLYGVYRKQGALADLERLTGYATVAWPKNSLHWVARAEVLFFLGRLPEAWACYDWRFEASHVQHAAQSRAIFGLAYWGGEPLFDKSVLIWTEQGPGDELMYSTMISEIRSLVHRLTIRCSDRMQPLLARSFPEIAVFGETVPPEALSGIEVQASIVAFAKVLRPSFEAFGRVPKFLVADPKSVDALRQRYRAASNDILIGIAWRSSGVLYSDGKTVNLGEWGALFAVPGVRFVNLQYGDCSREIAGIKSEFGADVIHDLTINPLENLDAHAAQIAAMDIVVCSSNTAAHFAGALGIDTHCMVPATAGFGLRWYWFEYSGRSAWYPCTRIWSQKKPKQWGDVILAVTLQVVRKVYQLRPEVDVSSFMLNLAGAYRANHQPDNAVAVLETIAALPGQEALGLFELGRLAKDEGKLGSARAMYDQALAHKPNWPALLNMSGVVSAALSDLPTAEIRYRRAIELSPEMYEAYNNLGTLVRRMGRGPEAHTFYAKANELCPGNPNILLNLATNLTELNRPQEAIPYFDQLIALQPEYAEAHHSRGMALLTAGRLSEGWSELQWRLRVDHETVRPDERSLPLWAGQPLNGKNVLVWTEQGLGDEILASSMILDFKALACAATLVCAPRLVPLFRRSFPDIDVLSRDGLSQIALNRFDYQLSMSELGAAFRPNLQSFPPRYGFLKAEQHKTSLLRARYKNNTTRPLVGLSWVSANPETGMLKSLTLECMVRALLVDGSKAPVLLSLQYGDHDEELTATSKNTGQPIMFDADVDAIADFDTFAAQVAAMDLVVTISNTTAHLAGALGVPTVLLLPFNRGRHWYWFRVCEVCPWYPSVKYAYQDSDSTWANALTFAHLSLRDVLIDPVTVP
jgi:tetratricopeptide (TPR) repeat protein